MTAQNKITAKQAQSEIGVEVYLRRSFDGTLSYISRKRDAVKAIVREVRPADYHGRQGWVLVTDIGETEAVPSHQTFMRVTPLTDDAPAPADTVDKIDAALAEMAPTVTAERRTEIVDANMPLTQEQEQEEAEEALPLLKVENDEHDEVLSAEWQLMRDNFRNAMQSAPSDAARRFWARKLEAL